VPIDAVYTWVNFLDPAWREQYNHFADLESRPRRSDPTNTAEIRHSDHGELRYSLRSLARYAPFIRRVYLVIDGTPPEWLHTDAPGIRVLSSREIFPEGFRLPVYSSDLIESFLWRIPDLSEHYVYFNDDMLLAGDCAESDFFDSEGRSIVRLKPELIGMRIDTREATYSQMLRNTGRAIRKRLTLRYRPRVDTRKPWVPLLARRIVQGRAPLNMVAHMAQPFQRSLWPLFHDTFRQELNSLAASRFRDGRGFCVNVAYHYLAYAQGRAVVSFDSKDMIVARGPALARPDVWREKIRKARENGLKFLCFNDGVGGSDQEWAQFIDDTLRETLDTPSRWERSPAAANRAAGSQ
jgi:hypothetical protein